MHSRQEPSREKSHVRSSWASVAGMEQARMRQSPICRGVWIVSGLVSFCFNEFCFYSEATKGC